MRPVVAGQPSTRSPSPHRPRIRRMQLAKADVAVPPPLMADGPSAVRMAVSCRFVRCRGGVVWQFPCLQLPRHLAFHPVFLARHIHSTTPQPHKPAWVALWLMVSHRGVTTATGVGVLAGALAAPVPCGTAVCIIMALWLRARASSWVC